MIVKQGKLILFFSFILLALAGFSSNAAPPPSSEVCPLASNDIKARVATNQVGGIVGLPVLLKVLMNPTEPPSGFYYSALVDVLQAPRGPEPEVLTGVPETSIRCFTPGKYLLQVRVNLIAKSSCGGAKATILIDEKVTLNIKAKAGS
ncbi:MAG: hypothetical protein KQH53_04450 [Desulfarculaceae bacterium]|nr:hypothetical protein [Desulfarculaceae bacterium]